VHDFHDITIQQMNAGTGNIDLAKLAEELRAVRAKMKADPDDSVTHDAAIAAVGQAAEAAAAGDSGGTMRHLKDAGKWAVDAAMAIGAALAVEVGKKAIGM